MKKRFALLLAYGLAPFLLYAQHSPLVVPAGGNSFVKHAPGQGDSVTEAGWESWTHPQAVFNTYCRLSRPGKLRVKLRLSVPGSNALISLSIGSKVHLLRLRAGDSLVDAGTWTIYQPGYVCITAKGVQRTGAEYARVQALVVDGTAADSGAVYVKNNTGHNFYWGRRGPSVHINYTAPVADSIEWFYSELTVPPGQDPAGSYYMANGFAEGYFGMQVNSPSERRIIFSVWSPFPTDDPAGIPDSLRVRLLQKGSGVVAEDFGNEGSGGHSHLVYNWSAGTTYRFLLQGLPDSGNHTRFTAWFYDPLTARWLLVARFLRPGSRTWLKHLHAFLENFEPEAGDRTRTGYYFNQWVKPAGGSWLPIREMKLSADATGRQGFRSDYDGGMRQGKCFLSNGGFFSQSADLHRVYRLETNGKQLLIAAGSLPWQR